MSEQKPLEIPVDDASFRQLLARAGEVAQKVQIEEIGLVDTVAKKTLRSDGELPSNIKLGFEIEHSLSREEKKLAVLVRYRFDAQYGDTPAIIANDDPPLSVRATFMAQYRIDVLDGLSEDHITAFAYMNGAFNTWPFWREYLQSVLTRMGLPPIAIPVFQPKKIAKTMNEREQVGSHSPIAETTEVVGGVASQ